ncbi:hypothetical protein [Mucilaginibacter sp.]|nr:hypothetical protein [Mucilaginibacter sp.]
MSYYLLLYQRVITTYALHQQEYSRDQAGSFKQVSKAICQLNEVK